MKTVTPPTAASLSMDRRFTVEGPLPMVRPGESIGYFTESEIAQSNYLRYRSNATHSTDTYHVVNDSGDVAGYVSFGVAREDHKGSTCIFVEIEFIYVMQGFRRRGLSTLLVQAVLRKVWTELHAGIDVCKFPKVYVHSTSHPNCPGGTKVLRALERELLLLIKSRAGTELIGRHLEHPPTARERLWARHMSGAVSP